MPLQEDHTDPAKVLGATYAGIAHAVAALSDLDFYRPTRCRGLAVADLLVHIRMDAERALVAFATASRPPADRDAVSYWRDWQRPDDDAAYRHARFLRTAALAYDRPSEGLVQQWRDTTEAAVRAAETAPADGYVSTQDQVLSVPDFIATLIVEAAVHHIDLQPAIGADSGPPNAAMRVVTHTLDGLLGGEAMPLTGWNPTSYALIGCGREPLTDADRTRLGDLADHFPLLG